MNFDLEDNFEIKLHPWTTFGRKVQLGSILAFWKGHNKFYNLDYMENFVKMAVFHVPFLDRLV